MSESKKSYHKLTARRGERTRKKRAPSVTPSAAPASSEPRASRAEGAETPPGEASTALSPLSSAWSMRRLVVILVLSSGLLLGLTVPGHDVRFAWVAVYLPMFLALDLILRGGGTRKMQVLKTFACTWPVGAMMALITGGWVVNTSYVFGGLALPIAWIVNVLGYGSLLGLEIFAFLGIPFLLARHRFWFALLLIPLWASFFQLYIPRFLFWTYGQEMFPVPELIQVSDLLGPAGLNLLLIPLQLILLEWVKRSYAADGIPRRSLRICTAVLAVLFAADYGYGAWRLAALAAPHPNARHVQLVGIQPNFSLKDLASNPALSPSDRQMSLRSLVSDTNAALLKGGVMSTAPTVVVWPESVYPVPYFEAPQARAQIEAWAQALGVHLLLATIDNRYMPGPDGRMDWESFGAAVHVAPGGVPEVYHKMNLIPFGETIPFADVIPGWAAALKAVVPRISQFAAGHDPTVFKIADGVVVAPMICFDVFDFRPALGMAERGANVGVVMGNLAWFGRSTATLQFEGFVKFRAIEDRMPILMLSQNGESLLINDRGEPASARLGLFEVGALSLDVTAGPGSVYGHNGRWIDGLYGAGLGVLLLAGWGWPWVRRTVLKRKL